jgi:hypothetical protein
VAYNCYITVGYSFPALQRGFFFYRRRTLVNLLDKIEKSRPPLYQYFVDSLSSVKKNNIFSKGKRAPSDMNTLFFRLLLDGANSHLPDKKKVLSKSMRRLDL